MIENPLRNLPSVDQLLQNPVLKTVVQQASRTAVVQKVRGVLDDVRKQVTGAASEVSIPTPDQIAETVAAWVQKDEGGRLRPVINATGVLLHTGLGRAPLPKAAVDAIATLSESYCSLEFDLPTGNRGKRTVSVEPLLAELTGAEAVAIVNNNAAATMLTLAACCSGGEVIVSRGQLVEIGGSFRLPDVMNSAGCRLVEVGTTNKTRIGDYKDALNENTAGLLRVHPSNYVVVGFTQNASLKELVDLGREKNLPVIDDIGSGAMADFAKFGLGNEPTVAESLSKGADITLFSGDKLLGGPQCGIIVGKKKWINKIAKHPMMRAFRVGKMTLAALQATLELYRDPEVAAEQVPLLRSLNTKIENLKLRADKIVTQLQANDFVSSCKVIDSQATIGGGSIPTQMVPSVSIEVESEKLSATQLSEKLRTTETSMVCQVQDDRLQINMKTLNVREDRLVVKAFAEIC